MSFEDATPEEIQKFMDGVFSGEIDFKGYLSREIDIDNSDFREQGLSIQVALENEDDRHALLTFSDKVATVSFPGLGPQAIKEIAYLLLVWLEKKRQANRENN